MAISTGSSTEKQYISEKRVLITDLDVLLDFSSFMNQPV